MMNTELTYKSLVEQLTDALMDQIEQEQLGPGDALPTAAALMRIHGVSRPVVREALKILEGRGVIEMAVGRSAVIRPLSEEVLTSFFQRAISLEDKNFKEVMEVRYGVELQSANLAAQRRTQEQLHDLQTLLQEMRTHIDDSETFIDLDVQFHMLIAGATQNELLYYLLNGIRDALQDVMHERARFQPSSEDLKLVQEAHEKIVDMIATSNPEGATQAMALHLDDAVRAVIL
ncbi:MAG: FadR family transcriptional regulator [Chloroflexi bacterium]|nr:FadR family transcriptional regulator [Chloroflexota bacterium]